LCRVSSHPQSAAAPRFARRIDPEAFGPIADRPLAETAKSSSPDDLFPGASRFLNARVQRRRHELLAAAAPILDRLLQPEEKVLYVSQAFQQPPVMHLLALGRLAQVYHQVLLVLTDRRLIEVLLTPRGKSPDTRLRTWTWKDAAKVEVGWFRKLTVTPAKGKKQAWSLAAGGDRKILKMLAPRLRDRLAVEGSGTAMALPYWHCPKCASAVAEDAVRCGACGTAFRSSRLAVWLSIAFPGAGLFYAGHPVLATFDFLGEALVFGLFAFMLTMARDAAEVAGLTMGLSIFVVLTKVESVHLSHILARRTRPDTPERQGAFRRFAIAGGVVSLLFVGGAAVATGAARPVVDHDLDPESDAGWLVTRTPAEFEDFAEDRTARSQWSHPAGLTVTMFAYPLTRLESPEQFRADFRQAIQAEGARLVLEDEDLPAPFRGFRVVRESTDNDGTPATLIDYFVFDSEGRDIHQFFAAVRSEDAAIAEPMVRAAVAGARWIGATPPQR
jgi:hypothetical protein